MPAAMPTSQCVWMISLRMADWPKNKLKWRAGWMR